MSDKQADPTVAGSMLTALIGLTLLGIGVGLAYGGEWTLIVLGAVFVVYSLFLGFKPRRVETLLYADKTINR